MPDFTNRRAFLSRSFALGCSIAASPLMTPIALAAAPGENRLVVIILRGAMDGLDVLRPVGDPHLLALRPTLFGEAADAPGLALDNYFMLHPALDGLFVIVAGGRTGFCPRDLDPLP